MDIGFLSEIIEATVYHSYMSVHMNINLDYITIDKLNVILALNVLC